MSNAAATLPRRHQFGADNYARLGAAGILCAALHPQPGKSLLLAKVAERRPACDREKAPPLYARAGILAGRSNLRGLLQVEIGETRP